ncbi:MULTISPECIES: hypothetical protein [unclassified Modestobacter]
MNDAGWWRTPLWQYAVFALVIYSRAAAERLAVPVEDVARWIAARHDLGPSAWPVVVTGESTRRGEQGLCLALSSRPA